MGSGLYDSSSGQQMVKRHRPGHGPAGTIEVNRDDVAKPTVLNFVIYTDLSRQVQAGPDRILDPRSANRKRDSARHIGILAKGVSFV